MIRYFFELESVVPRDVFLRRSTNSIFSGRASRPVLFSDVDDTLQKLEFLRQSRRFINLQILNLCQDNKKLIFA